MQILKLNATSLQQTTADISQTTTFYYEDQKDFHKKKKILIYDCEAFIDTNTTFYLFTKRSERFLMSF